MKKVFTGMISAGAVFLLGLLCVSASDFSGRQETAAIRARDGSCSYDADRDGACDRRADLSTVCVYDADGDGTCDRRADLSAPCVYDADGDGACDRRESGGRIQGGFRGRGIQRRQNR